MRRPSGPTPATSPASEPTAATPLASTAPASLCTGSRAIIPISTRPILPAAPATIRFAMCAGAPATRASNRVRLGSGRFGGRRFSGRRRRCGGRGGACSGLGLVVLCAEAQSKALLAALFEGTGLVPRLGHFARLPQPVMFAAIVLGYRLASAILCLAASLACHHTFFRRPH